MKIDFDFLTAIICVVIWAIITYILKFIKKKDNMYILFFSLFFAYLCEVINYTQFPIYFSSSMRKQCGQTIFNTANYIPLLYLNSKNIRTSVLNIVLTIPFGFFIPFFKKIRMKSIILYSLLIGVSIELLQLIIALIVGFTFRYLDINDVIFNFIGSLIGYLIYIIVIKIFRKLYNKFNIKDNDFIAFILKS